MSRKNRKKHSRSKTRRKIPASAPRFIPHNLRVFGCEGHISQSLAFAFRRRVNNQVKRKMHEKFRHAAHSIVGGRFQHSVVRLSRRNGWMIVDGTWVTYPPKDVLKDAVFKLIALQPRLQQSEAYDLVRSSLAKCFAATKALRRTLARRTTAAA